MITLHVFMQLIKLHVHACIKTETKSHLSLSTCTCTCTMYLSLNTHNNVIITGFSSGENSSQGVARAWLTMPSWIINKDTFLSLEATDKRGDQPILFPFSRQFPYVIDRGT